MATVDLSTSTFEQAVLGGGIVLVDFWAAWCGPCRMFAPTFDKASAKHPDIVFGKVDTEAERELASAAGIMSIPTLMGFRDGILVYNQAGAASASALDGVIQAIRDLDMEKIHAQIAERRASAEA